MDQTEDIRRVMVGVINTHVESTDKVSERNRLEKKFGQVWNTTEIQEDFEVHGFMAPFVTVIRRKDGLKGSMMFQHSPRFYFGFEIS